MSGHANTPSYFHSEDVFAKIQREQKDLQNAHTTIDVTSPTPKGLPQCQYKGIDVISPEPDDADGVDVYRTKMLKQARKLGRIPATAVPSFGPSGKVRCPKHPSMLIKDPILMSVIAGGRRASPRCKQELSGERPRSIQLFPSICASRTLIENVVTSRFHRPTSPNPLLSNPTVRNFRVDGRDLTAALLVGRSQEEIIWSPDSRALIVTMILGSAGPTSADVVYAGDDPFPGRPSITEVMRKDFASRHGDRCWSSANVAGLA